MFWFCFMHNLWFLYTCQYILLVMLGYWLSISRWLYVVISCILTLILYPDPVGNDQPCTVISSNCLWIVGLHSWLNLLNMSWSYHQMFHLCKCKFKGGDSCCGRARPSPPAPLHNPLSLLSQGFWRRRAVGAKKSSLFEKRWNCCSFCENQVSPGYWPSFAI